MNLLLLADAFMCVSNLHKEQHDDHVKRIALFSMDAIEAANSTLVSEDDPELGCINLRVGFHTGPVVANVVGSKNPRYCLCKSQSTYLSILDDSHASGSWRHGQRLVSYGEQQREEPYSLE